MVPHALSLSPYNSVPKKNFPWVTYLMEVASPPHAPTWGCSLTVRKAKQQSVVDVIFGFSTENIINLENIFSRRELHYKELSSVKGFVKQFQPATNDKVSTTSIPTTGQEAFQDSKP